MKVIFLITSYILFVVASPVPPKHIHDNGTNMLPTGIHESATLQSNANWLPTAPDQRSNTKDAHHNQPDRDPASEKAASKHNTIDTYVFGKTVDGKDVTLGLMHPRKLPSLRDLPKGLDKWDNSALEKLANAISDRYTIIREVLDDSNLISQALRFVGDGKFTSLPQNVQPIEMPSLPEPGNPHFKKRLLEIIEVSHKRLRETMHRRNSKLMTLSNIPHSNDIPNANTLNVYVSYWKENKIPFKPRAPRVSNRYTYSFGQTKDDKDVTQGIGRREEMINIHSLPQGLDGFKAPELALIANDIADKASIFRKVMDDAIIIQQAIKLLQKEPIESRPTRLTVLDLSTLRSGDKNDKNKLIKMIKTCHNKLQAAVNHRNQFLRQLYKLRVPLTNFNNADHNNVYVKYWRDNQTLQPAGASDPLTHSSGKTQRSGVGNISLDNKKRPGSTNGPESPDGSKPSKQLKMPYNNLATSNINRNEHPELWDMLQPVDRTLGHSQADRGTSLVLSPNHLTPGHGLRHPNPGMENVHGSLADNKELSEESWTGFDIPSDPNIPVDPALHTLFGGSKQA